MCLTLLNEMHRESSEHGDSDIGQMAGGTLLVLKAGEHPMREIELSVKRLQQAEVNLRGVLFNDIRSQSRSYGAGRYNYQYSYDKN